MTIIKLFAVKIIMHIKVRADPSNSSRATGSDLRGFYSFQIFTAATKSLFSAKRQFFAV